MFIGIEIKQKTNFGYHFNISDRLVTYCRFNLIKSINSVDIPYSSHNIARSQPDRLLLYNGSQNLNNWKPLFFCLNVNCDILKSKQKFGKRMASTQQCQTRAHLLTSQCRVQVDAAYVHNHDKHVVQRSKLQVKPTLTSISQIVQYNKDPYL